MKKMPPFLLALLLLACSCAPEELCEEDSVSDMVVSFKTETSGLLSDTTIADLTIYGIREGQPTWLLYDSVTLSEILLPLDPHHDESEFVFQANGKTDTLGLKHQSEIYLISYACGFGHQFTLDPEMQYGEGMILKDSLINPEVNTSLEDIEAHIWLYF